MITPKEKAEELVKEFSKFAKQESYEKKNYNAIECALIAVEEVFLAIGDDYFKKYEFYLEVKRQLEKL